jgi:hypothetical protein
VRAYIDPVSLAVRVTVPDGPGRRNAIFLPQISAGAQGTISISVVWGRMEKPCACMIAHYSNHGPTIGINISSPEHAATNVFAYRILDPISSFSHLLHLACAAMAPRGWGSGLRTDPLVDIRATSTFPASVSQIKSRAVSVGGIRWEIDRNSILSHDYRVVDPARTRTRHLSYCYCTATVLRPSSQRGNPRISSRSSGGIRFDIPGHRKFQYLFFAPYSHLRHPR